MTIEGIAKLATKKLGSSDKSIPVHVTALLNKAIDEVRKDQQQHLDVADAKFLKGSRFLFLTNYDNLALENQTRQEALLAVKEPLFVAHSLKEQFQLF